MNIYDTIFMLAAVRELPIEFTFFRDRYFPTNESLDVFGTSKVLADYKDDSSRKKAPFVLPRVGAVPATREGFSTYELEPANICISMPLTLDQLKNRGFGESILSELTPENRARQMLMGDLDKLSARISRTEEFLAVQTILGNGCTMRHITDQSGIYEDIECKFYEGDSNPAAFSPADTWTHSTKSGESWVPGNWYADICSMIEMLTKRGRPAKEILVSEDVAEFLMCDGWINAMLDNRRAGFGGLNPEDLGEDTYELGTFAFKGKKMRILCNSSTYEDESGNDVPYLPAGTVIVISPACGRGLYGAVTQLEDDGEFHTYAGRRIPQYIFTKRPPTKETQLSCRPLFVPNRANPWTIAQNVFGA